jgi:division protein CdvB (Snf7/Vps24/ESCRT-III family)
VWAEGKLIKGFIRSRPPPFRETVTNSIHTLRVQQGKLGMASHRLKERDRVLFNTCVSALRNKNKDRASICANEISEVRKLIQFLYNVELAIERVILRLETIRELSEIVVDLKPALRLLQGVSQELISVLPDVSSELSKVNDTISETLYETKLTADESTIPVNYRTAGGQEILKEVSCYLQQKAEETLPEPPAMMKIPEAEHTTIKEMIAISSEMSKTAGQKTVEGSERDSSQTLFSYKKSEIKEISLKVDGSQKLEDVLLDYVKKSNGQIDMSRCSVDLETSNEEIEKALQSLGSKGKIKIELETGE